MQAASIGSHRAFMVLSMTVIVCLSFGMMIGWRTHFEEMEVRRRLRQFENQDAQRRLNQQQEAQYSEKPEVDPVKTSSGLDNSREAVALTDLMPDATSLERRRERLDEGLPRQVAIQRLDFKPESPEWLAAASVLERYFKATTYEERLPWVWDWQRVAPLMKRFYESGGREPERGEVLEATQGQGRFRLDGEEIAYFGFASSRYFGKIEVALRRSEDAKDDWKVDWESYVGAGDMSWEQFKSERPTQPVLMRVFARSGDYHNYEFSDQARLLSLQLLDDLGNPMAFAYCERSSALAAYLERDLGFEAMITKGYTVRLAFPENAQSSQCVWLKEIVAARWILPR